MTVDEVGEGVCRFRIQSRGTRRLGFEVNAYLLGDLLIDSGFSHGGEAFLAALSGRHVAAVACTHNHEDHTGNCAAIAAAHGCPVFLREADRLWEEGVRSLAPYRRAWWGPVAEFEATELPEVMTTSDRRLEVIPTPGHSRTQVAFFERATGYVFSGDLFVSPGATAVLIWGNPWQEAESLRRVAALAPRRMLTGHGAIVDDPAPSLELKADRIEDAARRSLELTAKGLSPRRIASRVFAKGRMKDRFFELLTTREFSRLNFVKAAVSNAPKSYKL